MKFYMLDGNEKILCAVPSKDIISLYQNLNYHQADTIEGSLVLSEKYTSILNNVRYFAISDRESNHNFYLYRKTLVQVQNHEIAINGQGAFWDEMQGAYIKDRRPNQVTPADTIKLILGYSRWNVDYVDQMLEEESLRRDMNFYYVSLLDALNTVYQTWQVDIEPYINIEGHQITRRYVKLYQQQGGNNGRRFVYGDNALTVTQQANEGSIFTALVGRGAGVEETDADGNLTGGYSRKINFADVEWSKANGDPVDKPKGQEYVEWKESTEIYGYSDGKPRIGIVDFDNEKDPAQLLKETWAQLQQVGVPLVQFQATVGDVGYLNLGETVTIVRYDLDIKYQTRVTGIKWNRCDEAKSQITIGVKAIQSTADKIAALQQSVAQANVNADEAKSTANHAIIDGTGAVANYGPNEPTNPKEGDIWYDVQPDGTVVLKQYQNGQWVILIDDTTGQQIKNKVEAQQKELDKAVQDANAASAKADGLVAQVGTASSNAQQAMTMAQQAQGDIANAKNQLTATQQSLQVVQSDLSSVKQQAIDQGKTIVSLQQSDISLTSQIADAQGDITGLKQTASSLQSSVADNKNNISNLSVKSDEISSTVSNLTDLNRTNYFVGSSSQPMNIVIDSSGNGVILGRIAIADVGLQVGDQCTLAFYAITPSSEAKAAINFYNGDTLLSNKMADYFNAVPQKAQGYTFVTFQIPDNCTHIEPYLRSFNGSGKTFVVSEEEIVKGTVRLPWVACFKDVASTQAVTQVSQTIDEIKATVQNNTGDISQLKQTASSLQSNIQSKTDISQFTQLSNAFQTVVQNIGPFYPDGDFSDTDLSKYYDPWDTCTSLDNFSVVTDNSDWGYYLQICTPQGTINKMITKEYLPINANYPITFKGKSLLSYDGKLKGKFRVYYHFYDNNKNQVGPLYADWYKYDNNNVWQDFSSTLTPPSGAVYLRIETVLDNSEGTGTYWGALDNLSIENGEATIASKISQMSDDINLRVQKGDLLSQINIQAGSTLIQSKKLFLDASSVVFSGNAFIPSAAITDLSADKITAGTLNAGNVNIINLDVNKLVGNTTEFVRSGWTNAYGSHVQIDGGGMAVSYGDWHTRFDGSGMTFKDGNEDIGGFTRIGMQGAPSRYGGLAFNAGGDAEFLSIGAKDYHNDSQNPVPAKLVWMRKNINTYGYHSGWNFCDDVWANQVGMSSIQYDDWNIHFEKVSGNDGFSALTLVSGSGNGFYWGSDGSFGYVTNHGGLHNVRGSQIVHDINQNDGTCQRWSSVN